MKKLIIKAIAAYLIPLLRKEAKKTPTLIDDYMIDMVEKVFYILINGKSK